MDRIGSIIGGATSTKTRATQQTYMKNPKTPWSELTNIWNNIYQKLPKDLPYHQWPYGTLGESHGDKSDKKHIQKAKLQDRRKVKV